MVPLGADSEGTILNSGPILRVSVCVFVCLDRGVSIIYVCIYTRPLLLVVLLIACRSRIHVATHNKHQQASRSAVLKISWSYPEFGTVIYFFICKYVIHMYL